MQVQHIDAKDRGVTHNEWLYSRHSFSFGQYHNLNRLNFGTLRVFNDDVVEPGKGFSMHSHDNMEIVTIVLAGALKHTDSAGNQGILNAGDIQRMSAGKGIEHSEYNASKSEKVHFLQIWIYPEERNLQPSWQQKTFHPEILKNTLVPIVSNAFDTALSIHQDALFLLGHFDVEQTINHIPKSKKHGEYIFIIDGEVEMGDKILKKGDSAEVIQADRLELKTKAPTQLLIIEVSVSTL